MQSNFTKKDLEGAFPRVATFQTSHGTH